MSVGTKNSEQTRQRILRAARHEFATSGYRAATVHSIAAAATVSPNLITRYFGGKEGLFAAASQVHLGVEQMFEGPRDEIGARMARTIVARWTTMTGSDPLLALLRASGEMQSAASQLAEFLDKESLGPLRAQLEGYGMSAEEAALRAQGVDVFLLGVTARRRMLRNDLGDPEELEAWVAVTIQRLIDAE